MPPTLPPVTTPTLTLVEGTCFAISATTGEMHAEEVDGLYFRDTRFISGWNLQLDGEPSQALSAQPQAPYDAIFLGRRHGGEGSNLLIQRHRMVGDGMREDIVLRNLGTENTACRLELRITTDFADLFSVKDGSPVPLGEVTWSYSAGTLSAEARSTDRQRAVQIHFDEATSPAPGTLVVNAVVPARGEWTGSIQVSPIVDGVVTAPAFPRNEPVSETAPAERFRAWRHGSPGLDLPDNNLDYVLDRSVQDLGALRVPSGETGPDDSTSDTIVAAGAPWFMTLFGRDSLLTAWMALPIDPDLALSTLRALADRQGTKVDPLNDEEPGRILHEVRHGYFPLSPGSPTYYGSIDSTPLFVMLVGELHRWGIPASHLAPLMPHVDRALEWILTYGDKDGDGFVEYKRATDRGILNQGWKDSGNSVRFRDGRTGEPPIALAEVQGYVYAAFVARAELAGTFDSEGVAATWMARAADLRAKFHEAFWLPEQGWFAMALDASKRPVDALTSNIGHCLWTGIIEPSYASSVAKHLLSPEMFTGWGIRTMSSESAAYDPVSYHNGSVWPHDTALCVAGLARYGFADEARRVALGILDAAVAFSGRLPELFCGFDREEFPYPVGYPTACSPQAWAAATPLLLLRTLLGLDPDVPHNKVYLEPKLPAEFGTVEVSRLPLAGTRVRLTASNGAAELYDLPPGLTVVGDRLPV